MADYGQFCPVAKAAGLFGERWMLLVLRELMLGTHRFNDFQRALSRVSPSLLSKRLGELEQAGIVVKKARQGRRGFEYFLTPAGRELGPVIEQLAIWGMRWARGQLSDDELDVEFLMWDIQRRLQTDALADGETVLCFIFDELQQFKSWWLLITDAGVDLCTENPGRDVDLYITTSVRSLVEIWDGDLPIKTALKRELLKCQGDRQLVKSMPDWLGICLYADTRRGDPEMMRVAEGS